MTTSMMKMVWLTWLYYRYRRPLIRWWLGVDNDGANDGENELQECKKGFFLFFFAKKQVKTLSTRCVRPAGALQVLNDHKKTPMRIILRDIITAFWFLTYKGFDEEALQRS